MNKEIQKLECLSQISSAIIDTPTLSIASFGIEKDSSTKQLIYTGRVDSNVKKNYASLAVSSIALTGVGVVATSTTLSTIGLVVGVTAAGGVAATGIGIPIAVLILSLGYIKYREKKKEQEEKDRMYKELIAKQQAAINRQNQINRELEEKLRDQKSTTEQLRMEIDKLKQEIKNLMDLIQVLTEQINQFKQTA